MVEYLKGKVLRGVSAAKYHTIVLGADGEVFTWGHRLVTPRRVVVARCLKKGGNTNLKFHRMERLQVISVAAGTTHNTALTADGALFYWVSSDPDLKCQQIFSMCGRNIVNISAGKYWTAVATSTGDVFMWDAKKRKDETPIFTRVHGVKRATFVCVGETHMLVLSSIYHPEYPPKPKSQGLKSMLEWNGGTEELGEDILFDDVQPNSGLSGSSGEMSKGVPSLKSLCEKVAVEYLLEPKNSIQLLEIADSLEAKELKKHCEDLAIRNLDYIFTVGASSIMNASSEILVNLEKLLDEKSSEPWSQHRLPTMTATYPAVIDSDVEEDEAREFPKTRKCGKSASRPSAMSSDDSFLQKDCTAEQAVSKQIRALRKKLQQIEILEAKQLAGHQLDSQQVAKLESRAALEGELAELGIPSEIYSTSSACPAEGRTNRKPEVSKKQKRKNKQSTQTPSVKNEPGQQIPITELQVLQVNVSAEKGGVCR
ncbi:ankyrin repeat family protein / regulator of chromosome condensation (RCC1) family protein [Zea mays]|uniref:Ankyrin repeat family protein / regulator of chromosome condensation (RCC1) family protein n=1 Tax=Zea mays TaxID=4577 RepID=A0A1D6HSZ7_MAIZE|nr:ankyrin repeat family protein / regulator of chromosome condensation (RCC1) family protein [Zea mays]